MANPQKKYLGKIALFLAVMSSLCFLFIHIYIGGSIALVLATVAALTGDLIFAAATVSVLLLMTEFLGMLFLPTASKELSLLVVVLFLLPTFAICYKTLRQQSKMKLYSFLLLGAVLLVLYDTELIKLPGLHKQLHPTVDQTSWILPNTPCLDNVEPICLVNSSVDLVASLESNYQKAKTLNNVQSLSFLKLSLQ